MASAELATNSAYDVITPSETLIGMEPVSEIVETAIYSTYLRDAVPISLMLVGPSGAGKSKLIMQYRAVRGCHLTTDITSMGLQQLLVADKERKMRFIIIPDFNIVLSHRQSTLHLTIGNLLSAMSEGTIRIDDGRQIKETPHDPIAIISAMTREIYSGFGKKWAALGFSRRFLPINYDYSLMTRLKIQKAIAEGKIGGMPLQPKKINAPPDSEVNISQEQADILMVFSNELAVNIGWVPLRGKYQNNEYKPRALFTGKQMEFSPHVILRTLARAHALRDGRTTVDDGDMNFVTRLIQFTRYDQAPQL